MSIRCHICDRDKNEPEFPVTRYRISNNICSKCLGELDKLKTSSSKKYQQSTYFQTGIEVEIKKRICLRCGEQFISRNDYRLCHMCHIANHKLDTYWEDPYRVEKI